MMQFRSIAVACILSGVGALSSFSQNASDQLTIGDPAPDLTYSKWIKGTPVKSVRDNDKIFVVEFWATWCGPCIAAMPHLSELAKKYKKQAIFIGANVWEKTGDQPYESSLPKVEKFVKGSGERMSYNVIADNNAQDLVNNWLRPAGIQGIPSTFVVRDGKITWIGHPMHLDSILGLVVTGQFDMAQFKKEYDRKLNASARSRAQRKAFLDSVRNYVKEREFDSAFAMLARNVGDTVQLFRNRMEKLDLLLDYFPESEAIAWARQLNKDSLYIVSTSLAIVEKDSLSRESYLYAVEGLRDYLRQNEFPDIIYSRIAKAYYKAGDHQQAVENQQIAVDVAKREIDNPGFRGRIFDYTIAEYEDDLKKYKAAIKSPARD